MKFFNSKFGKCVCGSISIMLAVILTGVLSLAALMVECGRYMSAKQLLEEITMSSAYSMLANYDKTLKDRFGLFGLQTKSVTDAAYNEYLEFNADQSLDDTFVANDTSKYFNSISGRVDLKYDLANVNVLKRQILEYSKFRAPITIASDMLDIDEMIKELKKQAENIIPGLKTMLDVAESVTNLAEGFKALYSLYKNVLKLDMSIVGGDKSIKDILSTEFGELWKDLETLITGEEDWGTADPPYEDAFKAFKEAVQNKVNYMKNNPEPPDPGPAPSSNLSNLETIYNNAKTKKENLDFLYDLLDFAKENEYCGNNGIKGESEKISDLISDESMTKQPSKKRLADYSLTENSTRKDLFKAINKMLENWLGSSYKMSSFNKATLNSTLETITTQKNTANSAYTTAQTNYNSAKSEHSAYNKKAEAKKKYDEDIASLDEKINTAKTNLNSALTIVSTELTSYKSKIVKITGTLSKARQSLSKLNSSLSPLNPSAGYSSTALSNAEGNTVFTYFSDQLVSAEEQRASLGMGFCNEQIAALAEFEASDITSSFVFSNHFKKGDLQSFYMGAMQLSGFLFSLQSIALFDEMMKTDVLQIISVFNTIRKVVNPIPAAFSLTCTVSLNESTTKILPSKINNGAGSTEPRDETDITQLSAMIEDVRQELGGIYQQDINNVDPNVRLPEAQLMTKLAESINNISNVFAKLMTDSSFEMLLKNVPGMGLFVAVVKLVVFVADIISIYKDIVFVCGHIGETFELLLSSLGESLLLNQYALMQFPHRMNNKIKGLNCEARVLIPNKNRVDQTFSGAHVEYIINGSKSEIENQTVCFYSIFAVRMINNIFNIINDGKVMELISACNVFAPLVFILWLYLESNVDMNMLVLLNMEVPLIKTGLFLSPAKLQNSSDKITRAFEDMKIDDSMTDEELAAELDYGAMRISGATKEFLQIDGPFKMKYGDYLWFYLFLVPNQTKVIRMADLIQMEMRFTEGGKSNKTAFLMSETHTYVRATSTATFNSILPIMSMGSEGMDEQGLTVETVKYVGY